jgi:hypothetical protein
MQGQICVSAHASSFRVRLRVRTEFLRHLYKRGELERSGIGLRQTLIPFADRELRAADIF